jgi:hypothetical protein
MSLFDDTSSTSQRKRDKRLRRDVSKVVRDLDELAIDAQADIAGRAEAEASPEQIHIALATPAEYEDLVGDALNSLLETARATSRHDRPEPDIKLRSLAGAVDKDGNPLGPRDRDLLRASAVVARAIGSYKRSFPDEWSAGAPGSLSGSAVELAALGSRGDPKHDISLRETLLDQKLEVTPAAIVLTAMLASPAPPQEVAHRMLRTLSAELAQRRSDNARQKHSYIEALLKNRGAALRELADVPMHPAAQANSSGRSAPSRPHMTG